jgi:hypothetical protein
LCGRRLALAFVTARTLDGFFLWHNR